MRVVPAALVCVLASALPRLVLLVLLVLAAGAASAEDADVSAKVGDRWTPAFAIAAGVAFQQQEASVESFDVTNSEVLRPFDDGRDWIVTPYVGASFELQSPQVDLIPGSPSFFVNAEILPSFAATLDIAKEGSPGNLGRPGRMFFSVTTACPTGINCFDQGALTGVGSRTTAKVDTLSYAAHAGVSIPLELFGRQLHVKPSVGWYRYSVEVDGLVVAGLKASFGDPDIREVTLKDDDTQSFDAIGPGIEIEMDLGRRGPIAPSLYFEGHGYRIISDRTVDLSDSVDLRCDRPPLASSCNAVSPPATYQADWHFKVNPWIYRVGIGMRFRWVGY